MTRSHLITDWLPPGRQAAICFSIDDVHPGTSDDAYEAGGDLADGALGYVVRLLAQHPDLKATVFVTPNWRPQDLVARRSLGTRIPWLRNHVYWTTRQPADHLRVDRHPRFVAYLNALERVEVATHGLHHLHRGPRFAVEYQGQSEQDCRDSLREGLRIFRQAGLNHSFGFQPPAWNLPENLVNALARSRYRYVSSARDLTTPISADARTDMSGLKGASLLFPQWLREDRLLHLSSNFQATSNPSRAFEIADAGGLIAIKAHIFKHAGGHTMVDGLDDRYCAFLSELFTALAERYGDALWWTSMGSIAARIAPPC